ncbi:hypothetical protein Bbelb_242210, partial [Branchiostoma belcheri]
SWSKWLGDSARMCSVGRGACVHGMSRTPELSLRSANVRKTTATRGPVSTTFKRDRNA